MVNWREPNLMRLIEFQPWMNSNLRLVNWFVKFHWFIKDLTDTGKIQSVILAGWYSLKGGLNHWMTEYLSLRRRPEFFNLRLRLRSPNFLAENFHLSRRFRKMVFFPLIDPKSFEMGLVLSLQTEIHQSKTLFF